MCFSANCKAGNVALTQLYTSAFVYKFVYGMVASLLSSHLHPFTRLPPSPHYIARSLSSLFTSPLVHLPLSVLLHTSPRLLYNSICYLSTWHTGCLYSSPSKKKHNNYRLSRSRPRSLALILFVCFLLLNRFIPILCSQLVLL